MVYYCVSAKGSTSYFWGSYFYEGKARREMCKLYQQVRLNEPFDGGCLWTVGEESESWAEIPVFKKKKKGKAL